METQTTKKIRELSVAFIAELDEQNFPTTEFEYIKLGVATEDGDLQRLEITATYSGWILYNRFKDLWLAK